MKKIFSFGTLAAIMLGGIAADAAELPSFALTGFPITPVQVQVVGASHVEERSPIPTLKLGGMPASPHQISAVTPRSTIATSPPPPAQPSSAASKPVRTKATPHHRAPVRAEATASLGARGDERVHDRGR